MNSRPTPAQAIARDIAQRCAAGALDAQQTEQAALEAFRRAFRLTKRQAEHLWIQHTTPHHPMPCA